MQKKEAAFLPRSNPLEASPYDVVTYQGYEARSLFVQACWEHERVGGVADIGRGEEEGIDT